MFEVERNSPIETGVLTEFFARCGWQEPGADTKVEWALASSDEWVAFKLDGELIGFGRSCRLDAVNRVVFDALVDPRFEDTGLRSVIVRILTEGAGGLEVVSVFSRRGADPAVSPASEDAEVQPGYFPTAPRGTYLGRQRTAWGGDG